MEYDDAIPLGLGLGLLAASPTEEVDMGQKQSHNFNWPWHDPTTSAIEEYTTTTAISPLSPIIEGDTTTTRNLSTVAESEWFHILAQIISSTLLFILIFGMSATVDVQHLRQQCSNKWAILTGVATQFLVMPVLGFTSVILLTGHGLTEPMAISLLIVTASPGGSYSNWWISMFNGDLALSVTMTAISTLISTIMLPANLLLYVNAAFGLRSSSGQDKGASVLDNINWASLFVSLAIVIVAIGLGLCASFKISSHRFNRFSNRMGNMSGVLLIVFSAVVSALGGSNESQIWGQPWSFYVGVTAPCLVGLCIATVLAIIARLRKPEVISVGVECCYQNVGIATSAAVAMFDDPIDRGQALCVPLFYGLMEGVVLGIYCIIGWKLGWTKAPRDEKLCVMLVTTYEVADETERNERDEFVGGQLDEEGGPPENRDTVEIQDAWQNDSSVDHSSSWQMDSITDLVAFDKADNVQYSRCRINSEDSAGGITALTAPISDTASAANGSPTSLDVSISTGSPTANKNLAKNF